MKLYFVLLLCWCTSYSSISQTLSDSLIAHFNFDGNVLDHSPMGNDLVLYDGVEEYASTPNGDSSLVLDGNTRFSSINPFDNSDFEATAISLCFKASAITPNLQIMLQGAYMGFGVYLAPNTGKAIGFFDFSSTGSVQSNDVLTDGEWHHIVVQSDGNVTSMYVDGEFNGSKAEPMITGDGSLNNRLYIGRSNVLAQPFTGQLNDVRIYNRTLTEKEIIELSSKPITVSLEDNKIISEQKKLIIYPNPTSQLISIAPEDIYTYQVFNLHGQLVLYGRGASIDVSQLVAGTYHLLINESIAKTFIKVND